VFDPDGVTPAALYADQTGLVPLANPLPTGVPSTSAGIDVRGNGSFYAEPGPYVMAVVVAGQEVYRSPITVNVDEPSASVIPGSSYIHDQSIASAVWTIVHNLAYRPAVFVIDSAGNEWHGVISHVDGNSLTITFTTAFGGTAYLS
jgi:hypothetical protein